jgi:hypothetical protein
MTDDLDNLGLTPAADLTVETVKEVETATEELPSPTLITNAVSPEVLLVEWRPCGNGVSDEAAGCVCVHAEQEGNEQVVSVPESLERLLSDPVVGSGVDQEHAKQHDVSSNTTGFRVVNLKGNLRSDLYNFDVKEAVAVSCCFRMELMLLT